MLRTVRATRYVTPLREGGSLPAIVEGDDDGLYVLKFRGAGQGPLALVAELIAGELGRAVGLKVPELVFVQVDEALGRNEPDEEIRDLLKASIGVNLALDYLPGSIMFDRAANDVADAATASRGVWFDAFVMNVDRTLKNPNLLLWHKQLYFIDHGAALYFHHNWDTAGQLAASPFTAVKHHVLLPWASKLPEAAAEIEPLITETLLNEVAGQIPPEWLAGSNGRGRYPEYLLKRLGASSKFLAEAVRAHAEL